MIEENVENVRIQVVHRDADLTNWTISSTESLSSYSIGFPTWVLKLNTKLDDLIEPRALNEPSSLHQLDGKPSKRKPNRVLLFQINFVKQP